MTEKIYIIFCKNCKKQQRTISRGRELPIGKTRKCYYCNHSIKISKENLVGEAIGR